MLCHRIVAVSAALVLFWLCGTCSLNAQNSRSDEATMTRELARAREQVTADQLDSAIVLCENLLGRLRQLDKMNSPLGLKVQLAYGVALEHKGLDTSALHVLFRTQKSSESIGQWEIYAETSRALALLYEKIGRADQSIHQLRLAQSAIAQHGPDSIYPRFAIRIASWHRMFGDQDSTVFYAREVLLTAPKFGQTFEEAEGHLLLGLTLKKYEDRLEHYTAAARLYRKVKNYTSLCGIFNNIANLHFGKGKLMEALAYTDSTFKTAPKAFARGSTELHILHGAYQLRGEIYEDLGRPTALHYIKQGYEMKLAYVRAQNREALIAVDARYTDLRKSRQIEEQSRQIESEKERRKWATVLFLIALLFFAVLGYFYFRLRRVNLKTRVQSEQLKSLDAAKTRFFANVSHELRTPLTLLLGPIGTLLKESRLTDKQTNLLQMANQSGKQLEQLVTDILDLGKLEMGKMELDEKPTGLAAFFRSHFAQFESLAESRNLGFSYEIDVPDDTVANLDQAKCRQILNNLLANAFKFTPPGGRVEARLALNAGTLQLTVADNGPGIHPDDLSHLFDRYFQTTRPDKPAEGGTGIGLALCQEYVQLFGGKIEVESALGAGTLFRVLFPVKFMDNLQAPDAAPEIQSLLQPVRPALAAPSEPFDATKPTVLVVEDNPDLQAYIRLILSEKYHVVSAANGREALSMMNDELKMMNTKQDAVNSSFLIHHSLLPISFPSLILSDLMMPVMDGYQLLEKLKSGDATRYIPVIMLTARAEARDKLRALRIGVDDYLIKPFDEEELLVRIENLLKNQAARRSVVISEVEPEAATPLLSPPDREWLETFEDYVLQHYADETLSVPSLAIKFAMSESTLLRQLKRLTGLSPIQYLQEVRLDEARRLIESRRYDSIAQVASQVGYPDARSFARSFRARFGKLPSEV